jgi:acyl-coenzyme A thioesterase PaaI-like protein
MIQVIHELAEKLPIVQSLSTDPEWTSQDAFDGLSSEAKKVRLTSGPLGGTRALGGFRRAFYHKTSGESVTIIHFGDAISGFPKITHGGVIATVLDEVLGICAIRQFPAKTGVTANLELNYLAPAQTGHFYIIRAVPVAQGMTDRKCFVTGTVETVTGRILVEAKGLFVVPKKLALRPITT